jgi:hypothetical protein
MELEHIMLNKISQEQKDKTIYGSTYL